MYTIKVDSFKIDEKVIIAQDYLLPKIYEAVNIRNNQVIFSNDIIKYIINNFTNNEKGVRNLKRCLETILSKLNVIRLTQLDNIESTLINNFKGQMLSSYSNRLTNESSNQSSKLTLSYQIKGIKFPLLITREIIEKLLKINKRSIPFHMYT